MIEDDVIIPQAGATTLAEAEDDACTHRGTSRFFLNFEKKLTPDQRENQEFIS